jgi:uncharacterized protein YkwD
MSLLGVVRSSLRAPLLAGGALCLAAAPGAPAQSAPSFARGPSAPAVPVVAAAPSSRYDALERAIVDELNRVRADPEAYAEELEARLPYFRGALFRRPTDSVATRTAEGAGAVREAVRALRSAPPAPPLRLSPGMSRGARDHVRDQGPRGGLEHVGTDRSTMGERVNRYGEWHRRVSENMTFGPASAADVVAALLIDDAVPDRSHRRVVLDPTLRLAGVACGPHRTYRVMCVIDHAAVYAERGGGDGTRAVAAEASAPRRQR